MTFFHPSSANLCKPPLEDSDGLFSNRVEQKEEKKSFFTGCPWRFFSFLTLHLPIK